MKLALKVWKNHVRKVWLVLVLHGSPWFTNWCKMFKKVTAITIAWSLRRLIWKPLYVTVYMHQLHCLANYQITITKCNKLVQLTPVNHSTLLSLCTLIYIFFLGIKVFPGYTIRVLALRNILETVSPTTYPEINRLSRCPSFVCFCLQLWCNCPSYKYK